MENKKAIQIIFVAALCISLAMNAALVFLIVRTTDNLKKEREAQIASRKVTSFTNLFIEKVLKAGKDVNFEDRLALETSVRSINDEEILSQWKKFTECSNPTDAQKEVKNLLALLLKKISN